MTGLSYLALLVCVPPRLQLGLSSGEKVVKVKYSYLFAKAIEAGDMDAFQFLVDIGRRDDVFGARLESE